MILKRPGLITKKATHAEFILGEQSNDKENSTHLYRKAQDGNSKTMPKTLPSIASSASAINLEGSLLFPNSHRVLSQNTDYRQMCNSSTSSRTSPLTEKNKGLENEALAISTSTNTTTMTPATTTMTMTNNTTSSPASASASSVKKRSKLKEKLFMKLQRERNDSKIAKKNSDSGKSLSPFLSSPPRQCRPELSLSACLDDRQRSTQGLKHLVEAEKRLKTNGLEESFNQDAKSSVRTTEVKINRNPDQTRVKELYHQNYMSSDVHFNPPKSPFNRKMRDNLETPDDQDEGDINNSKGYGTVSPHVALIKTNIFSTSFDNRDTEIDDDTETEDDDTNITGSIPSTYYNTQDRSQRYLQQEQKTNSHDSKLPQYSTPLTSISHLQPSQKLEVHVENDVLWEESRRRSCPQAPSHSLNSQEGSTSSRHSQHTSHQPRPQTLHFHSYVHQSPSSQSSVSNNSESLTSNHNYGNRIQNISVTKTASHSSTFTTTSAISAPEQQQVTPCKDNVMVRSSSQSSFKTFKRPHSYQQPPSMSSPTTQYKDNLTLKDSLISPSKHQAQNSYTSRSDDRFLKQQDQQQQQQQQHLQQFRQHQQQLQHHRRLLQPQQPHSQYSQYPPQQHPQQHLYERQPHYQQPHQKQPHHQQTHYLQPHSHHQSQLHHQPQQHQTQQHQTQLQQTHLQQTQLQQTQQQQHLLGHRFNSFKNQPESISRDSYINYDDRLRTSKAENNSKKVYHQYLLHQQQKNRCGYAFHNRSYQDYRHNYNTNNNPESTLSTHYHRDPKDLRQSHYEYHSKKFRENKEEPSMGIQGDNSYQRSPILSSADVYPHSSQTRDLSDTKYCTSYHPQYHLKERNAAEYHGMQNYDSHALESNGSLKTSKHNYNYNYNSNSDSSKIGVKNANKSSTKTDNSTKSNKTSSKTNKKRTKTKKNSTKTNNNSTKTNKNSTRTNKKSAKTKELDLTKHNCQKSMENSSNRYAHNNANNNNSKINQSSIVVTTHNNDNDRFNKDSYNNDSSLINSSCALRSPGPPISPAPESAIEKLLLMKQSRAHSPALPVSKSIAIVDQEKKETLCEAPKRKNKTVSTTSSATTTSTTHSACASFQSSTQPTSKKSKSGICTTDGCNVTATFGYPYGKARECCSKCKKQGMINYKARRLLNAQLNNSNIPCCQSLSCKGFPQFNFPFTDKGIFCRRCQKPGMVVITPSPKSRSFAKTGTPAARFTATAPMNKKHGQSSPYCQSLGCVGFAQFNFPSAQEGIFCFSCKKPDMIMVCNNQLIDVQSQKNDQIQDHMLGRRNVDLGANSNFHKAAFSISSCTPNVPLTSFSASASLPFPSSKESGSSIAHAKAINQKRENKSDLKKAKPKAIILTTCRGKGCSNKTPTFTFSYNYIRNQLNNLYCEECKVEGMINDKQWTKLAQTKDMKGKYVNGKAVCLGDGCTICPTFHHPEGIGSIYCSECKLEGMYNAKKRRLIRIEGLLEKSNAGEIDASGSEECNKRNTKEGDEAAFSEMDNYLMKENKKQEQEAKEEREKNLMIQKKRECILSLEMTRKVFQDLLHDFLRPSSVFYSYLSVTSSAFLSSLPLVPQQRNHINQQQHQHPAINNIQAQHPELALDIKKNTTKNRGVASSSLQSHHRENLLELMDLHAREHQGLVSKKIAVKSRLQEKIELLYQSQVSQIDIVEKKVVQKAFQQQKKNAHISVISDGIVNHDPQRKEEMCDSNSDSECQLTIETLGRRKFATQQRKILKVFSSLEQDLENFVLAYEEAVCSLEVYFESFFQDLLQAQHQQLVQLNKHHQLQLKSGNKIPRFSGTPAIASTLDYPKAKDLLLSCFTCAGHGLAHASPPQMVLCKFCSKGADEKNKINKTNDTSGNNENINKYRNNNNQPNGNTDSNITSNNKSNRGTGDGIGNVKSGSHHQLYYCMKSCGKKCASPHCKIYCCVSCFSENSITSESNMLICPECHEFKCDDCTLEEKKQKLPKLAPDSNSWIANCTNCKAQLQMKTKVNS